jgi:hypothetical protein
LLAFAGQFAGLFAFGNTLGPVWHILSLGIMLGMVVAQIAGLVFVFLLSTKVYGTGLGILFAILTVLPCLGILVLLMINSKATTVLRQNGHKVGLLGADLSKFSCE